MPLPKPSCFVVMPFSPEMHYFYLYLRKYVEDKHNLICERGDDRVTTLPLSEKIRSMIQKADVIIADCTGKNPNVMYEIGLAHAFERKVVLLTRDAIESIPSDVRQFEFVKYDPSDHVNFLRSIDKALDNIFKQRYDEQFKKAAKYFDELAATCHVARKATQDEFAAKYRAADAAGEIISSARLLVFIVANPTDPEVMSHIVKFEPAKEETPAEFTMEVGVRMEAEVVRAVVPKDKADKTGSSE